MSPELSLILADLDRHATIFDVDEVGGEVLDIMAGAILARMDEERDPDGAPWPALSPGYEVSKGKMAPGAPMAVLYGHMKTLEQVKGQRIMGPDSAAMEFGVDEAAKQLGSWFSEGDSDQPPRAFYALSDEAIRLVDEYLTKRLADRL